MKKLFLLILLIPLIPLVSFGQDINKESNGYTEVIEVELTKKEIHQKINEWIAVNFKSAQDVIQLNTEDMVIAKGNFSVDFSFKKYTFTYRIHNSLTFSIRDNKYKIDLVPNRVSIGVGRDVNSSFLTKYISSKSVLYAAYLLDKTVWDNEIKSTFQSIKDYVSKSNDGD